MICHQPCITLLTSNSKFVFPQTRLTAAEKQRRYREKRDADPVKRDLYLQKEKKKYKEDLKTGKRKRVADMTPRERRGAKKVWRDYKRAKTAEKKAKNKENESTPEKSHMTVSRQKMQAINQSESERKNLKKENKKLKEEIKRLKNKNKTFQRKAKKLTVRMFPQYQTECLTPESKAYKLTSPLTGKEDAHVKKVRRTLKFHFAVMNELKSLKKQNRKAIRFEGHFLRKYKCLNQLHRDLKIAHVRRNTKSKLLSTIQKEKVNIRDFFLRPDNSRILTGMKKTVTLKKLKKQKRLLKDSISNLYRKYVAETTSNISFTSFWRSKPFWVRQPSESERNTCMCKSCDNIKLLAMRLFDFNIIKTDDLQILIEDSCCASKTKDCFYGCCKLCGSRDVTSEDISDLTLESQWEQWTTVKEQRTLLNGKEKIVTFTKKMTETGTIENLINNFKKMFRQYKMHVYNIINQFEHFGRIRKELSRNEAIIHVDFAQNYVAKMGKEVQSVHFGASKNQITLHTGTCTTVSDSNLDIAPFCGVSDSLKHTPSSIWAFILPVLKNLKMKFPHVDTLHFFSDGPCTQYRQKHNFYLFKKFVHELGFKFASWNFFEAGHGKGAPDGIGGSVKRSADLRVKYGNDVCTASQFVSQLKKADTSVKVYEVTGNDIAEVEKLIPEKLKAVQNTMRLHQVITVGQNTNCLYHRDVSCICNPGHEHKEHALKHHAIQRDKSKKNKRKSAPVSNADIIPPVEEPLPQLAQTHSSIDASIALKRLESCNSFALLHHECEAQKPYVPLIQGRKRALIFDKIMIDTFATGLIPKDLNSSQRLFAGKVRADGDCLPGSGSVFAFGTDQQSDLLRLKIIHELVLNSDFYTSEKNMLKGFVKKTSENELIKAYAMYSDKFIPGTPFSIRHIYEQEVLGLLKPKSYMGIWQIFALASVLRMKVFSVYPMLGNPNVRNHLHRMIEPRINSSQQTAFIMWTSTRSKSPYNWLPNHFVPLLSFK